MRKSNRLLLITSLIFFSTFSYSQVVNTKVVKKLNNELHKIALFNIGRSHNTLRDDKIEYRKNLKRNQFISLDVDSVCSYGKYTLYAYYRNSLHRSYYYLVIEQVKRDIKYHFVRGYFIEDILSRLNRIPKQLNESDKLSFLCEFNTFHQKYRAENSLNKTIQNPSSEVEIKRNGKIKYNNSKKPVSSTGTSNTFLE